MSVIETAINCHKQGDDEAAVRLCHQILTETPNDIEGERHYVEPREGLLVMWPSHYIHNTVPCQDTRQRLTMGFNIYPVD